MLLHALYRSPETRPCDAENVLIYNVGTGNFTWAAVGGLRFERCVACPEPPGPLDGPALHHSRNAASSPEGGFACWAEGRVLAEWPHAAMP